MRDDTSSSDGGLDEGVELFVSANGELQMPRSDALHLKIFAGVPRQLEHLSREVFEDGGRVDGSRGSDALRMVDRLFEEAVDTTDWELKPGLGRPRLGRLFGCGGFSALATFSSFTTFS